ncbi:MAG: F0F1 ATP synthase subunit delta [Puniceicoccales bacterium]|jgi:hypothetical protein|nr:F0F1 ATP synthase subunit delta [Puniceicoccales bacterium]
MLSKKKVYSLAKRLAQRSFDSSTNCIHEEHVREIIALIRETPEYIRSLFLKKYSYFLEVAWMNRTIKIEYAGDCDFLKLQNQIEQRVQKKLPFEAIPAPELIVGFRMTVGDWIWERSVRSDLNMLCNS